MKTTRDIKFYKEMGGLSPQSISEFFNSHDRLENVPIGEKLDDNSYAGQGSIRMKKAVDKNIVTGRYTTVLGTKNEVEGDNSLICGNNNTSLSAEGVDSNGNAVLYRISHFVLGGKNEVSGNMKYALGQALKVTAKKDNIAIALGIFNDDDPEALFMIGNGGGEENRKNALLIKRGSGDAIFQNSVTTNGALTVDGVIRGKSYLAVGSGNWSSPPNHTLTVGQGLSGGTDTPCQVNLGKYNIGYGNTAFNLGWGDNDTSRKTIFYIGNGGSPGGTKGVCYTCATAKEIKDAVSNGNYGKLITDQYLKTYVFDMIYPVGSIYLSLAETFDPNKAFGGEWIKLTDRFLVGAGDTYNLGAEGGSADAVVVSHYHTGTAYTTISGSGSHTHSIYGNIQSDLDDPVSTATYNKSIQCDDSITGKVITLSDAATIYTQSSGEHTHTASTNIEINSTGVSGKDANLPPYLAVYMWRRKA